MELNDLAWSVEEALAVESSDLPWHLIPSDCSRAERSRATALIIEIAQSVRSLGIPWLCATLVKHRDELSPDDERQLIRNVFHETSIRGASLTWSQVSLLGHSPWELALAEPIDRFALGTVIGETWRLEQRVAAGGVVVVYRAVSLDGQREVAMKVPRAAPSSIDDAYATHLRCEADLLARLDVDGVPRWKGFWETERGPVLAVEWVNVKQLRGLLEEWSLDRKLAAIAQVARIVDQVHQRDLIHGDIKAANLLVDQSDQVYLTDFNITRSAHPHDNVDGALPGTFPQMSPESLVGVASDADIAQDIYALGSLLYEVITAQPLVNHNERESALVASILRGGVHLPDFSDDTPQPLQDICRCATTRHVFLRFATSADFAESLEAYLQKETVEIPPPRRRLTAWRLGSSLGLCLSRIRALAERFSDGAVAADDQKLSKQQRASLQFAIGASIAADDVQLMSERLHWELPACGASKALASAFYNQRQLTTGDWRSLQQTAHEYQHWFAATWEYLQTKIARNEPTGFLMVASSIQARFAPSAAASRAGWRETALLAGIPLSLIEEFSNSFAICQTRQDWEKSIQRLEFRVTKWLRWPDLPVEPSEDSSAAADCF